MMAGLSLRSVLTFMIPVALAASLAGVVLSGYSRELEGLIGAVPEAPAASGLPHILDRVADSLSTADLSRLLAEQLAPTAGPDAAGGFKRACFTFLIARKFERERLQAFFFERTPFVLPRGSSVLGFKRAARAYFGISPGQLTTGEAILLFHLARFPDSPPPVDEPERAIDLRNRLLLELLNDELITAAQYQAESVRPLILAGSHPAVW